MQCTESKAILCKHKDSNYRLLFSLVKIMLKLNLLTIFHESNMNYFLFGVKITVLIYWYLYFLFIINFPNYCIFLILQENGQIRFKEQLQQCTNQLGQWNIRNIKSAITKSTNNKRNTNKVLFL